MSHGLLNFSDCFCDFVSHPNEIVPTADWLSENNLIEENCFLCDSFKESRSY